MWVTLIISSIFSSQLKQFEAQFPERCVVMETACLNALCSNMKRPRCSHFTTSELISTTSNITWTQRAVSDHPIRAPRLWSRQQSSDTVCKKGFIQTQNEFQCGEFQDHLFISVPRRIVTGSFGHSEHSFTVKKNQQTSFYRKSTPDRR